ncbi:hypothetical protein IC575_028920 [Cucumis melo]
MLAYRAAQDVVVADLAPTYPIRLGLALNFSVFYFEILNQSDKACSMAKEVSLILHVAFPLYIMSLCFITDHREEWVDSRTLLLFSLGPPFVDLCHFVFFLAYQTVCEKLCQVVLLQCDLVKLLSLR